MGNHYHFVLAAPQTRRYPAVKKRY
jgi:hypothetical protein